MPLTNEDIDRIGDKVALAIKSCVPKMIKEAVHDHVEACSAAADVKRLTNPQHGVEAKIAALGQTVQTSELRFARLVGYMVGAGLLASGSVLAGVRLLGI